MNLDKYLRNVSLKSLYLIAFSGLFFHALTLTFANTVGYRTTSSGYLWSHWIGFFGWAIPTAIGYRLFTPKDKGIARVIFPIASLLTGIGILTIWRLNTSFGFRQTLIYAFTVLLLTGVYYRLDLLAFVQKRLRWVLGGTVVLLAATLFLGVNPAGTGPSLWIGCCGIYMQPAEPLKILLILFIAFYLPTAFAGSKKLVKVASIGILILIILGLLFAQKDLGTGIIFLILILSMLAIYLKRPLISALSAIALITATVIGYLYVPIIKNRIDIWLHPWNDPTNTGYQVIQSLISIANGGLTGRGPGLGYPSLVPVAFSDFIFTAITEEQGLAIALLTLLFIAILMYAAFSIAKQAKSKEYCLLAGGIGVYIAAQSIIIIGGNIGLFPLTGVTLPFISYGGSSLFSSYVAILLLTFIARDGLDKEKKEDLTDLRLTEVLLVGLLTCGLIVGYWGSIRGNELLDRTDNPRRALSSLYSKRGAIVDRNNKPLVVTDGDQSSYDRNYLYPFLAPIIGYTHPAFGQTNIEASFDDYLRGERGSPDLEIWWQYLLYGRPPDGLNIRSTINIDTEQAFLKLFGENIGAGAIITPNNGELISAVSAPYADLNDDQTYLIDQQAENSPLLNRLSLGQYPSSLISRILEDAGLLNELPDDMANILADRHADSTPEIGFETADPVENLELISPLQALKLFTGFSNEGICVDPKFISAIQIKNENWVILPDQRTKSECFTAGQVSEYADAYNSTTGFFWSANTYDQESKIFLYIAGTNDSWTGTPLVMLVIFEDVDSSGDAAALDTFFKRTLLNK